jgi:ribosomal protein L34
VLHCKRPPVPSITRISPTGLAWALTTPIRKLSWAAIETLEPPVLVALLRTKTTGFRVRAGSSTGYEIIGHQRHCSGSAGSSRPEGVALSAGRRNCIPLVIWRAGNILLGDGSAQQVTSGSFRLNWLKNAEDAGQFRHWRIPTSALGDVRLLFP